MLGGDVPADCKESKIPTQAPDSQDQTRNEKQQFGIWLKSDINVLLFQVLAIPNVS